MVQGVRVHVLSEKRKECVSVILKLNVENCNAFLLIPYVDSCKNTFDEFTGVQEISYL